MTDLYKHKSWYYQGELNKNPINNLKAIIVSHAGNKESHNIMLECYNKVHDKFTECIILSTNHKTKNNHILNLNELNELNFNFIIKDYNLSLDKNNLVFKNEHSWKVQLPFLKLLNIKYITPILIGKYDINLINNLYTIITNNPNILIVINTDLLHCGPNYDNECPNYNIECQDRNKECQDVNKFNMNTVDNIKNYFGDNKTELHKYKNKLSTMCGYICMKLSLDLLKKLDVLLVHKKVLSYKFNKNSVGYPNFIFINKNIELLKIPRYILEIIHNIPLKSSKKTDDEINLLLNKYLKPLKYKKLKNKYGIFITIEKDNKLRGCLGTFKLSDDIGKTIAEKTIDTAFNDKRFEPITKEELNKLTYKVNFVYKPFIAYNDNTKDLIEIFNSIYIILGVHGITITFENNNKATYLANVVKKISSNKKKLELKDWIKIVNMLKKKSNGKGNIIKVELYKCEEFHEDEELILETNYNLPILLLGAALISQFKT